MVTLDPQIQGVLDHMASQPQPDHEPTLDEIRAGAKEGHLALAPTPSEMAEIRNESIPGPHGDIPVIIDIPRSTDDALPVLLYFHGGGLVLLDADAFNGTCTQIAEQADCIVVNVDYRLAPENPMPAPADDAFAAYQWVRENAASFGGDPARVGVCGDSAGGQLSALVCHRAKAAGVEQPTCQALIYPGTDMADRSEGMITIDAFINEPMVQMFASMSVPDGNVLDPAVSPLRATDHTGLAPAIVIAAEHDPLRAQGRAYVAVLEKAGVPVEYSLYDGMIHAFVTWGGAVDRANDAVAEVSAWVKGQFAG